LYGRNLSQIYNNNINLIPPALLLQLTPAYPGSPALQRKPGAGQGCHHRASKARRERQRCPREPKFPGKCPTGAAQASQQGVESAPESPPGSLLEHKRQPRVTRSTGKYGTLSGTAQANHRGLENASERPPLGAAAVPGADSRLFPPQTDPFLK
jgi:hypothetical protein